MERGQEGVKLNMGGWHWGRGWVDWAQVRAGTAALVPLDILTYPFLDPILLDLSYSIDLYQMLASTRKPFCTSEVDSWVKHQMSS